MQVDFSMMVRTCVRIPVFSLLFLYQIFCFSIVNALHCFFSPLYNIQALVFFIRCIFSLPFLYYQIFCFSITHAPHCSSSFLQNMRTFVFFIYCIYALFIYVLHLISLFIYQPGFIHLYTVFLPFF